MSVTHVTLVGPASPRDLADLLTGRDRESAESLAGYRGIPVSELARALVAAGIHVEIATTASDVEEPVMLDGPRLRLHVVPMRPRARDRALSAFRREREFLGKAIAASGGSIVHAHWTYEFAWAALDSGRPVVVTAHDAPLTILRHYRDAYRALRTAMAYAVGRRIRILTAVSPYLADRWRREMGFRRSIAVVPNIAPALPSPPRWAANGHMRIADVTDPGPCKNVGSLVRAFRLLRATRPELALDLIGPGLGSGDAFALALARDGGTDGIHLHGRVERDDLAGILSSASVFVHSSREECCSTAVLEAMRVGIPVVAGLGAGGTPWMVDDGRAGILVDVESPSAIADAVSSVLGDPELARELGKRGRDRVEAVFSPAAVASGYLGVYEQALAGAS